MKPIYFPFTYVPDAVAEALAACFGQFVVYRPAAENLPDPMHSWLNRGVMEVRVPAREKEHELKTAVKNFQNWADLHGQRSVEKAGLLKTHLASMPFSGKSSPSKIAADIKGKVHGNSNTPQPDAVLAARIFLYFAQELDRQNHELTDEFSRYDRQEADLMQRLKEEDDPVAGEFRTPAAQLTEFSADYMIPDRLAAWSRIFGLHPEASALFVTHRRAVLDCLLDYDSPADGIVHVETIPFCHMENGVSKVWQDKLARELAMLAGVQKDDSSLQRIEPLQLPAVENTAVLSLYRIKDQSPLEFFSRWCDTLLLPAADTACQCRFKHTLIAVIQV